LQNFTPGELKKTSLKPVATNTVRKNTILTPPAKKTKAVRGCGPSPGEKQGSGKKRKLFNTERSDPSPSPRRQAMSPSPGGKQGSGKKESCSTQNFSDKFPSPRRQAMSLEFA
jgi:hypothetical protein